MLTLPLMVRRPDAGGVPRLVPATAEVDDLGEVSCRLADGAAVELHPQELLAVRALLQERLLRSAGVRPCGRYEPKRG